MENKELFLVVMMISKWKRRPKLYSETTAIDELTHPIMQRTEDSHTLIKGN